GIIAAFGAVAAQELEIHFGAEGPGHDGLIVAAQRRSDGSGEGRGFDKAVIGLDGVADELAAENGAGHLVADVKPPAASLIARAADDGHGGRAGADDDNATL